MTTSWVSIKSGEDRSINNIADAGSTGKFECRFVQRTDNYFIIYVSSQAGCRQACKMCWLTETKQFDDTDATFHDLKAQVRQVLDVAPLDATMTRSLKKAHVNFMARGEPLDNDAILHGWPRIEKMIVTEVQSRVGTDIPVKIKISTTIPKARWRDIKKWAETVDPSHTELYYSLYHHDTEKNNSFIPKAVSTSAGLRLIKSINKRHGVRCKIHYPLIDGYNDSAEDAQGMVDLISELYTPTAELNLIEYNPPSNATQPSTNKEPHIEVLRNSQLSFKPIPKVGPDVHASCGMFV